VRQRYGLSQADVAQLHAWLADAGVRWGLDAEHRQPWGIDPAMPDADQNSWGFGLRRLLLGYALGPQAQQPLWQQTAAQPGVGGLDAAVIGGLLQWLEDMNRSLLALRADHAPADWLPLMQALLERFFKADDDADQRVLDQVLAPLQDWLADCVLAGFDEPVSLGVLRSHWAAQLDAIGLQRRFAAGGVQFATLMPMRAIPFKVVCVLGMNDNAYPRSPTPRDFDLISQPGHARAGDRARREDDRYLFLEALLSARQRLYISWQGRRASDHAPLPPSVLVAQLLDHLNQTHLQPDKQKKVFSAPLQPLQPFSAAYFQRGSGFATYAAEWATARRAPGLSVVGTGAGEPPPALLNNASLLTLLRQPLEVFFNHHLQVQLDAPLDEDDDNEPFGLKGLNAYKLTQQVLVSTQPEALLQRLQYQGELAMAAGGQAQQAQMLALQQRVRAQCQPWQQDSDVDLPLQVYGLQAHGAGLGLNWGGDPLRWRLHTDGTALQLAMRAGNVKQDKRIRLHTLVSLWLGHLTANAAGTVTTSVLIGEDGVLCLQPLPQPQAQALLEDLVALYQQAWAAPLPLPLKTACAYVTACAKAAQSKTPQYQVQRGLTAARTAFTGRRDAPGEHQTSLYVQRVFASFDDMDLDLFIALAEQLYSPMMAACASDEASSEQEAA
jgi:exodeoxyribonuclease V gamma subunit